MEDFYKVCNYSPQLFSVHEKKSFGDTAAVILTVCKEIIGADSGYIAVLTKDKVENQVVYMDSSNRESTIDPESPVLIHGLREICINLKHAVFDNEYENSEWKMLIPGGHIKLDNVLFAPILYNEEVLGLLGLTNKAGGFVPEDCTKADFFAGNAAISFINSRNSKKLQNAQKDLNIKNQWMDRLNEFLMNSITVKNEELYCQNLVKSMYGLFGNSLSVLIRLSENKEKWIFNGIGHKKSFPHGVIAHKKERAALKKSYHEVFYVHDNLAEILGGEGELYSVILSFLELKNTIILLLPFGKHDEIMGILLLELAENNFNENVVFFMKNLAEYSSLFIDNIRVYNELSRSIDLVSKAQDQLKRQERIKAMGVVASGIAHDINNTLAPITLYVEALLSSDDDVSKKGRKYLEVINRAVSDLENITSRLKMFYKNPDDSYEFSRINPEELLEEVLELTRPKWESIPNKEGRTVNIRFEAEEGIGIFGNVSDIREALINCIFNSVDAIGKTDPGEIVITVSLFGQNTCLSIRDNGCGMTKEESERCFEPFFSTKEKLGTGMGLSEVYGMIQRHKGEISLDTSPGNGTSISMFFPNPSEGKSVVSDNNVCSDNKTDRPLRIYCIDDDQRILDGLKIMLSLDGHNVSLFSSGDSAVEAMKSIKQGMKWPDLVLTDLGMQGMDGFAVAEALNHINPLIPVVMLTGWGRFIDEGKISESSIKKIITKPPRLQQLREIFCDLVRTENDEQ